MRFLIVDDEFVSLRKLEILFSYFGRCDTAETGEKALEKFYQANDDRHPYDLCVLDLEMPGKNGTEVIEDIRNWEAKKNNDRNIDPVKILIVTGKQDFDQIMHALNKGVEGYLLKPVNKDKIQTALKDIGLIRSRTSR